MARMPADRHAMVAVLRLAPARVKGVVLWPSIARHATLARWLNSTVRPCIVVPRPADRHVKVAVLKLAPARVKGVALAVPIDRRLPPKVRAAGCRRASSLDSIAKDRTPNARAQCAKLMRAAMLRKVAPRPVLARVMAVARWASIVRQ